MTGSEGMEVGIVEHALTELEQGNVLGMSLVEHKLFSGDDAELISILEELDKLTPDGRPSEGALGALIGHVYNLDSERVARSMEIFEGYEKLLMKLATSNAQHVESCLAAFCKAFCLPDESSSPRERSISCVQKILSLHSAAVRPFSRLLIKLFPHHRRTAEVIRAYSSSILELAQRQHSRYLSEHVVGIVVERITIIDAEAANHEGSIEESLREKLDELLFVVFSFIESHVDDSTRSGMDYFEYFYSAFERAILPAYRSSTAPYLLFYICSISQKFLRKVDERLRVLFFDKNATPTIRCSAIQYSAGIMSRLSTVGHEMLLSWINNTVGFLHSYLDSVGTEYCIDVDVHRAFYLAFACLAHVIVCRGSMFIGWGDNAELLRQMRLARIMYSSLNPLRAQKFALASEFCELLIANDVVDCSELLESLRTTGIPSQTRLGNRNLMEVTLPFQFVYLEKSQRFMQRSRIDDASANSRLDRRSGSCDQEVPTQLDTPMTEVVSQLAPDALA